MTCEDFPCCGHERGDCDGGLYGSDEAIMAGAAHHAFCDHEAGVFECEPGEVGECEAHEGEHEFVPHGSTEVGHEGCIRWVQT